MEHVKNRQDLPRSDQGGTTVQGIEQARPLLRDAHVLLDRRDDKRALLHQRVSLTLFQLVPSEALLGGYYRIQRGML